MQGSYDQINSPNTLRSTRTTSRSQAGQALGWA